MGFLRDDHRRLGLEVRTGIIPEGISETIGLYSYEECVFEGQLRLMRGSDGSCACQIGDKTYSTSNEDFREVVGGLVGRINEYEVNEKVVIRGFGELNKFSVVGGSAPEVYKTDEADSEAFKKLFE